MTPAEAIETIKGLAAAGRYVVSPHAQLRMDQRGVRPRDLRHALVNANLCRPSREGVGRWLVDGPDTDGDDLTVCCAIDGAVIVITLF